MISNLSGDINGAIKASILLPLMPILICVFSISAFTLLDITSEHHRKYILNFARKLGITETFKIEITKK